MAWLGGAILGLELLITIKYGQGMFPTPWPAPVIIAWSVAFFLFTTWTIYWYFIRLPRKVKNN